MSRVLNLALGVLVVAFAAGCSSNENTLQPTSGNPETASAPTVSVQVSPPPRPTDLPRGATPVVQSLALGEILREQATPQTDALRELTGGSCSNDLLVITTSLETVYGALTCDLFSGEQFQGHFQGKQAVLILEVSKERFQILIETLDGAQAEFSPEGIWIQ